MTEHRDPTATPPEHPREIHADDLDEMIENHDAPLLVDVRSADEFRHDHIPGALNVPLEILSSAADPNNPQHVERLHNHGNRVVVLYSNHNIRSARAAQILAGKQFSNVFYLTGGMDQWRSDGMAVIK
jgi:rhodanese-related sulfurtransferase